MIYLNPRSFFENLPSALAARVRPRGLALGGKFTPKARVPQRMNQIDFLPAGLSWQTLVILNHQHHHHHYLHHHQSPSASSQASTVNIIFDILGGVLEIKIN